MSTHLLFHFQDETRALILQDPVCPGSSVNSWISVPSTCARPRSTHSLLSILTAPPSPPPPHFQRLSGKLEVLRSSFGAVAPLETPPQCLQWLGGATPASTQKRPPTPHPLSEESKLEKIKSFKFMEIRPSLSCTDVGRDRTRLVFMVGRTASEPLIRAELCKTFVK